MLEQPSLQTDDLPVNERPHADVVRHQLFNLAENAGRFDSALLLFNTCTHHMLAEIRDPARRESAGGQRGPWHDWSIIAGRDAGMTLWHFMQAANAIQASLDKAKTLRHPIKMAEIQGATKDIREAFPHIKLMRDAVGHVAELVRTPEAIKANASKGFDFGGIRMGAGNFFQEGFSNCTFMTTAHGGSMVRYDLSQESLDKLTAITRRIYGAFPGRRLGPALPV